MSKESTNKKSKIVRMKEVLKNASKILIATGRRKTSAASVRIAPGSGKLFVNGKENYFVDSRHVMSVCQPFAATNTNDQYDVWCRVKGGGMTGQAEAVRHGISRALSKVSEEFHRVLRDGPFLTRDPRVVERKKPGQKKARKSTQFSKR